MPSLIWMLQLSSAHNCPVQAQPCAAQQLLSTQRLQQLRLTLHHLIAHQVSSWPTHSQASHKARQVCQTLQIYDLWLVPTQLLMAQLFGVQLLSTQLSRNQQLSCQILITQMNKSQAVVVFLRLMKGEQLQLGVVRQCHRDPGSDREGIEAAFLKQRKGRGLVQQVVAAVCQQSLPSKHSR